MAISEHIFYPLRYFRVWVRFVFSWQSWQWCLHHYNYLLVILIPPVAERARDAEEKKDINAKREFGQQNVAKERLSVI